MDKEQAIRYFLDGQEVPEKPGYGTEECTTLGDVVAGVRSFVTTIPGAARWQKEGAS